MSNDSAENVPEKPNLGGRPTAYKEEYNQQLIDHMAQGYSFESFAANVRVAVRTLYYWANEHDGFLQAKELGYALCRKKWETWGIAGMMGQVQGFNNTVWIFNMKNMFGYRDIHRIDSTQTNVNINIEADHESDAFKKVKRALLGTDDGVNQIKDVKPIRIKAGEGE